MIVQLLLFSLLKFAVQPYLTYPMGEMMQINGYKSEGEAL